ncbi:MAG: ergothioneine biosynthesis protein EgtC [Oscillatoria sp. PMC 1068.18]|nr:ergothioneine biosynthesis protein EgtC [Oscillatoria sp. PMC 1076.18]MEC4990364.1 ergothioneine biosynthesis protein EgtC [Oscillatoria sp. PMC 1068.18]
MCRLLGYLGKPIQLDQILYKPEHSLIVQSYQPREMHSAILNADGFGIGWYNLQQQTNPYIYRNTQPIWSDLNLPYLSRYINSDCHLAYVRSATAGLAVDLSNCQPFSSEKLHPDFDQRLLFLHNGYIDNFRQTLYRQIRNLLNDNSYQWISGNTDSEHIFALVLNELQNQSEINLEKALVKAITTIDKMAAVDQVKFSANAVIANGDKLIATRYANFLPQPTLYWLRDDPTYPDAVIIASEPLFKANWKAFPENSILSVEKNLEVTINRL